jgi:hypothetical protein
LTSRDAAMDGNAVREIIHTRRLSAFPCFVSSGYEMRRIFSCYAPTPARVQRRQGVRGPEWDPQRAKTRQIAFDATGRLTGRVDRALGIRPLCPSKRHELEVPSQCHHSTRPRPAGRLGLER